MLPHCPLLRTRQPTIPRTLTHTISCKAVDDSIIPLRVIGKATQAVPPWDVSEKDADPVVNLNTCEV